MKILLYEPTYLRIWERVRHIVPNANLIILKQDGTLWEDGHQLDPGELGFDVTYASPDLLVSGPPARKLIGLAMMSTRLDWFHFSAAGHEHPVMRAMIAKVPTFTRSDAMAPAIAEFVLASVFQSFHPFEERRAAQQNRRWERLSFRDVKGSCWLVVGMGSIGRAVAERAHALGARVIGVRRIPRGDEPVDEMVRAEELHLRLPEADVIVLCAPGSGDNTHLFSRSAFQVIKQGSVLVNISRGNLIDESALLEGLDQEAPRLAVLDVFETEPLPESSPLWSHPRVRITAHCAGASKSVLPRSDELFLSNLRAYVDNRALHLVVSRGAAESPAQ